MQFRPPFLDLKPVKKRTRPSLGPLLYFVLTLMVGGFLVWIFWPHEASKRTVAAKTAAPIAPMTVAKVAANPPAIAVASNPPPLVQKHAPPPGISGSRPVQTALEEQIALARLGISPGSIDGAAGSQTRFALAAFQRKIGLDPTGTLDSGTRAQLTIELPSTMEYTITAADLARLHPVPRTWLEKSQQHCLDFENITELLGEKAFCSPHLVRALNPDIDWSNVVAGTTVTLPLVEYPTPAPRPALIKISLRSCILEAFDDQTNLLVHFPCSIGRLAEKRPVGELHVITVALDPNYTFDPVVFPESSEGRQLGHKLIIPPGPNNPVGVAWIGLDRPGYGIHGTPAPEQVGRTESHGCFRLANWNADYLAHMVWVGLPVVVEN